MATTRAFLKETVLEKKILRPGIVKVVLHVDGPLEDGSVVKELADSTVYIKAIFTQESLNTFDMSLEDSFNSPPDWSQALLLLNQFRVVFQPALSPGNTEKRPRFALVVERFGLYSLHEGFYSKNAPNDIMADPEVQAKAMEMEKCYASRQVEDVNSQDVSDLPLSLLLDQMGQSSLADPPATALSQCELECDGPKEPERDGRAAVHTLQSALEQMRCLNCEDFIVSLEQQAALDLIPAWKDNYIHQATESSEEQQSELTTGGSLSAAFEGPTLRPEGGQVLGCPSSTSAQNVDSREKSASENRQQGGALAEEGGSASTVKETSNPTSAARTAAHAIVVDSVEVRDGAGARERMKDGKQSVTHGALVQHDIKVDQMAADGMGSSESSLDSSVHHPDVSFTISSLSSPEESSSSLGKEPTSLPVSTTDQPGMSASFSVGGENINAIHEAHKVQQQKKSEMNINSLSIDKNTNMLHFTTSVVAQEPKSADITCLTGKERGFVGDTEGEYFNGTSSGQVKVSGHTQRTGNSFESERAPQNEQNSSGAVQVPPSVSLSPVVEDEKSTDGEYFHNSVSFVTFSQGFVPSDMTSQDQISDESFSVQNKLTNNASVTDSAQASQSFIPTNMLTQDLVPDDSSFACKDLVQEVCESCGDKQLVSETLNRVVAQDGIQQRNYASSFSKTSITVEDTGKFRTASSENQATTETAQVQCENSVYAGQQANTQSNTENICSAADPVKESTDFTVHDSAQNSSSYGSQSPSLLSISDIPHIECHEKTSYVFVSETDETEHLRLTAYHKTQTGTVTHGNGQSVATCRNRLTLSPLPTKVSKPSGMSHPESLDSEKTSNSLVDCSVSSGSDDLFDRRLMQQITLHRSTNSHSEVCPHDNNETVVIPDSVENDVIVISSSGGSVGEACDTPSETQAQTVGELRDHIKISYHNRKKRECHAIIDSASCHNTGHCNKTNCQQSTSVINVGDCRMNSSPGVEHPSFSADISVDKDLSDSDISTEKRIIPVRKRVRIQDASPLQFQKRRKQNGKTDCSSDLSEHCPVVPSQSNVTVTQLSRPVSRKNSERKTSSICDTQATSEEVGARQKEKANCHQKQLTLDNSLRLNPVRAKERENSAGKTQSNPKETHSHAIHSMHKEMANTKHQKNHSVYSPKQIEGRAYVAGVNQGSESAGTCPVIKTKQSIHRAGLSSTGRVDSSSDEPEVMSISFYRTKDRVSKKTFNASVPKNREESTNYSPKDGQASELNNICSKHSPYTAQAHKNKVEQNQSTGRGDVMNRRDQIISTSAKHNDKARSPCRSPLVCDADQSLTVTSLRKAGPKLSSTRRQELDSSETDEEITSERAVGQQQLDDSETEEEITPEKEYSRHDLFEHMKAKYSSGDLQERMRANFHAWDEFMARLENPKQKRLRQLKLYDELLTKVEESLSRPCT